MRESEPATPWVSSKRMPLPQLCQQAPGTSGLHVTVSARLFCQEPQVSKWLVRACLCRKVWRLVHGLLTSWNAMLSTLAGVSAQDSSGCWGLRVAMTCRFWGGQSQTLGAEVSIHTPSPQGHADNALPPVAQPKCGTEPTSAVSCFSFTPSPASIGG